MVSLTKKINIPSTKNKSPINYQQLKNLNFFWKSNEIKYVGYGISF